LETESNLTEIRQPRYVAHQGGRTMKATMNRNASRSNRISVDNVKIAKQVARIFATVIDQEKKVETRREVLCEMTDFEPYSKY